MDRYLDDRDFIDSDGLGLDTAYEDAHETCLHCGERGHRPDADCPSSFCEAEPLVEHRGELMHPGCIDAFEAETDGVPVLVADDEPETTPVPFLTDSELLARFRAERGL